LLTLSTILFKLVDSVNYILKIFEIFKSSNLSTAVYILIERNSIRIRNLSLIACIVSFLTGCAISTPYPKLELPAAAKENGDKVVLVITHIVVDSTQREEFDRQTSKVANSMSRHEGLLGYSIRRQLFGDQAWTVSIWASTEAMQKFVASPVHVEAMIKSRPAIKATNFKRLQLKPSELPRSWDDVLAKLAEPGDLRSYGN
jgi:quinol monooxygenase YgiN